MFVPSGRPQTVSLVPLTTRLDSTVRANQFVFIRFVENSGRTWKFAVSTERSTSEFPNSKPTIRGTGAAMVRMAPEKR